MSFCIRIIQPGDNAPLAAIIRHSLEEFGADLPGTVYHDPTTDDLFELFRQPGSIYYVATKDETIIGGAGIYPSQGLPEGTAELVKMYLHRQSRGQGAGKLLMEKSLGFAKQSGYDQVYLETLPELALAVKVYERFGFERLNAPLGNTGHFGCSVWMIKSLKNEKL